MAIEYRITLDDYQFSYRIELDRVYAAEVAQSAAPSWTRLEHQQCSNCPAVVDLDRVIEDFQGLPAFKKVSVWGRSPGWELKGLVQSFSNYSWLIRRSGSAFTLPVRATPTLRRFSRSFLWRPASRIRWKRSCRRFALWSWALLSQPINPAISSIAAAASLMWVERFWQQI